MTPHSSKIRIRLVCGLVLLAVGQFLFVQGLAIAQYPGGHEWDKNAAGHSFWRNTFCDLGRTVSIGGQKNPMSRASRVSVVVLLLSTGLFWLILPRLFSDRPRLGQVVRVLGVVSLGGMIALGFTPTDKHPFAHAVANGAAAAPAISAFLLAGVGMFLSKQCPRPFVLASALLLVLAMIHFGQYIAHFWLGLAWTPEAPAAQKLAFLVGLAWMVLTAVWIWRRAGQARS